MGFTPSLQFRSGFIKKDRNAVKQYSRVKQIIRQIHLYLGLISGVVVVIVSLSGALYVFEEEGRALTQHRYFQVQQTGEVRRSLQELTDSVQWHYPKDRIVSIRFKENRDAAFLFTTKGRKAISVDPYTAHITGVRDLQSDFFSVVLDLHRTLLLGKVGKEIVRWNVLIFFVMCISGLFLWWPKQRRFWKKALRIHFRTKNWKRMNWDLHSVLGFYALLVLLVISLTGMFFVFDTVKDMVRVVTGQPAAKGIRGKMEHRSGVLARQPGVLDTAYCYMAVNYPGANETTINLPADSLAHIRIQRRYDYAIVRKQNTLFADQYTGRRMKEELYQNYTGYDLVARSNFDLHTGRIRALGMGSKLVYFLASLVAASLPVTGFMIWWGRKKKKRLVPSQAF